MDPDAFTAELDAVVKEVYYVLLTKDSLFGKSGDFLVGAYDDCIWITRTLRVGELVERSKVDLAHCANLTSEWLHRCSTEMKAIDLEKAKDERKRQKMADAKAKKELKAEAALAFGRIAQAQQFLKEQPLYYDNNKMWWAYNHTTASWAQTDEVDILNSVRAGLRIDTVDSKERSEIIEALRQTARANKPKELSRQWVQFNNTLVNCQTGERMSANYQYFSCNVIPHDIKQNPTPNIDRFFIEWVGEQYAPTLWEIAAYCMTQDQFLQRLIALTGGGSNGKGTFLQLLIRALGIDNTSASDIASLSSSRFGMSAIYKKLLCVVGEASYDDLKNTNAIKKLTGEDLSQFEFKGKNPFSDRSGCTIIMATNALPETPDQSVGFYRRWLIVDFPNSFPIKNDLLSCITEEEMQGFCWRCVSVLKSLYHKTSFTNEGTIEERRIKYEERSRPIEKFIDDTYLEDAEGKIELRRFAACFNDWLKRHHLRLMTARQVGFMLRNQGYTIGTRKLEREASSVTVILGLTKKPAEPAEPAKGDIELLRGKSSEDLAGFAGFAGSSLDKHGKHAQPIGKWLISNASKLKQTPNFVLIPNDCQPEVEDYVADGTIQHQQGMLAIPMQRYISIISQEEQQ